MAICLECGVKMRSDCKTGYCEKHSAGHRNRNMEMEYKQQAKYVKTPEGAAAKKKAGSKWYNSWKGKEYRTDAQLKRLYGISLSDKRIMYLGQDYRCKLCKFPIHFKQTHVDHDHESGKIRGILCGRCNNGLGFFNDNPDKLREAAKYLEA